jgi:UDP-glucose 4-epimerase
VIHLAAVADVKDVYEEPTYAESINARGTLNVLDAARRAGVGRVIYGSTTWVYSDCAPSQVDEDTLIPSPSHLYTATKLAGETYCYSYRHLYDVAYTILRFGIPYGPRAREGAVVPIFVGKALRGEPLTIAGEGTQFRKFVYVEDLAEGIVLGLRPNAVNRIYNLDGSERVTILQIAEAVRDAVGEVDIVHTEARPGDFSGKEVSSERALLELGWAARTPFRDGVERYVEWRRERVAGEERSWQAVDPALLA